MKSLIVYYSYSGNTEKAAMALKDVLSGKGEVDIVSLKPEDESSNFFRQSARAFMRKRALLKEAPFDVSAYDLICLGNPVWAFAPVPALNTYLDGVKNIKGKDTVCFITYGSGTGADRCLDIMKAALKEKGASGLNSFKIQQGRVGDEDFVRGAIEEAIK
ncbi:MAG: hypothetical protein ABH843_08045 [Candidatus Omnitrophota bacterium]